MATSLQKYIATYTTDAHGQIFLPGQDVTAYQQVSVEFSTSLRSASAMVVNCNMGLMGAPTIAATVGTFPLGGPAKIYTFAVVGPEFSIVITGGPPNTPVPVEAWAFFH